MLPKFYSGCGTRTIRTISISLTFPYIYIAPVIISWTPTWFGNERMISVRGFP